MAFREELADAMEMGVSSQPKKEKKTPENRAWESFQNAVLNYENREEFVHYWMNRCSPCRFCYLREHNVCLIAHKCEPRQTWEKDLQVALEAFADAKRYIKRDLAKLAELQSVPNN